jgi:hypothetical protein
MFTSLDSVVTGGLKVLNLGGIKMPTSTAFDFQIKGCIDAEMEGLSHVKRTTRISTDFDLYPITLRSRSFNALLAPREMFI